MNLSCVMVMVAIVLRVGERGTLVRQADHIARLLDEMRAHEDAIDRIRQQLIDVLGLTADGVQLSRPGQPGPPRPTRRLGALDSDSVAARILQALVELGGVSDRATIAERIEHPVRAVGSSLNYLRSGRGFVESVDDGWRITSAGRAALLTSGHPDPDPANNEGGA